MAPLPKRLRLTNARDVRLELQRLYAGARCGAVSTDVARTCGFLLRTMLESIRLDEFETRLRTVEERLK